MYSFRRWVGGLLVMGTVIVSAPSTGALQDTPERKSPKRLVLCLDGTWAGAYKEERRLDDNEPGHVLLKPANPLKLCRAVLPFDDASGRVQVVYYNIGVGARDVYPGPANTMLQRSDRILGGGWGAGFEENVEHALQFLVLNLDEGDEVFIFGFSRGAATARGVTQFLDWNHGLPKKEDAYYLPQFFREYVASHGDPTRFQSKLDAINDHRHRHGNRLPLEPFRAVRVKYLGVWDTVMALGSRFRSTSASTSTAGQTFYAGKVPAACVDHARQALAIDERRYDFRPEIWTDVRPEQKMEQRWFAGVHSNIGGGYVNDGLANIAFHWVLDGAIAEGLKIDSHFVNFYKKFALHSLYDSYSATYWTLDAFRFRLGKGRRSLVDVPETGRADIDPSVIARIRAKASELSPSADDRAVTEPYRPENVFQFLAQQPDLTKYLEKIGVPEGQNVLPDDVMRRIDELRKDSRGYR